MHSCAVLDLDANCTTVRRPHGDVSLLRRLRPKSARANALSSMDCPMSCRSALKSITVLRRRRQECLRLLGFTASKSRRILVVEKRYCTWLIDSDRWRAFGRVQTTLSSRPIPRVERPGCNAFGPADLSLRGAARARSDLSWLEVNRRPIEAVDADLEAQSHRRSVKTHVPFDGVPRFQHVKYIHVARDGRDVCMSYHNHCTGFARGSCEMDAIGLAEPALRRPYPRVDPDPAVHFHNWLTQAPSMEKPTGRLPLLFRLRKDLLECAQGGRTCFCAL